MKTTVIIISIYKNVIALKFVLDSILKQPVKVDRIITSEDTNSGAINKNYCNFTDT